MVCPDERELYFDLRDRENVYDAYFALGLTTDEPDIYLGGLPFPPGITISANYRAHGADVHLTWEQTRELRDTLTRLLREAGRE